MSQHASRTYQTQAIMTASPAQLVAMLYDRAIACLKEAINAIEAGEIEARWKANAKAIDIISHLAMTLDLEKGGQIAANLEQLYRFMIAQLVNVDVRNDPKPARDVIKLLEPLRESWHQLARSNGEAPRTAASSGSAGGPTGGTSVGLSA